MPANETDDRSRTDVAVEVTGTMAAIEGADSFSATARTRTNLSVPHLLSAARFSRQVSELEKENAGQEFGAFFENIVSCATACILTSVAALEANINEVFADRERHFPNIPSDVMDEFWKIFEQASITDKYDFALTLRAGAAMNKGAFPYQGVKVLIRLRNALTHFKPEWDDEQVEHAKLSQQLRQLVQPSQFCPGEPLFPKSWAAHSATAWAVNSSKAFIDEFHRCARLEPKLAAFHDRLVP